MKNNISTVFSEADFKEVKNALNVLKTKMPFLLSLSEDEVKGMIKMGSKSVDFVQDAQLVANEHPEILPGKFEKEEFEKDAALLKAILEIQVSLNELNKKVNDTAVAVGSDCMNAALMVYSYLGRAVSDDASLKPTYEKMAIRFAAQGRKKAKQ